MEQTKERGINAFFDETPVKHLVIKLGIPAMFAQFFNILYSIVDRIFVGRIPEAGDLALASIGVCAPALTAISAFAYMVGVGGASQMSIRLGQKDMEGAKKPVNNAFVMLIAISIVVTAAALFFKRPLLYLLGCDDSMYPLASRYFTIYAAGTIFPLLGIGMNHFILAQGFSRAGMISVVIGALTNLILDPILIFGLDMGIEGAAVATITAQAAMAVFTLWYLRRKKVPIRLEIGGYDLSVMKTIVLVGMMPFLITILDNGVVIILNASLRKYVGLDGTVYITCAAVIQSILTIVSCPAAGITQGCGTLYGYFYGAKETKKLDQTFTYVLWVCLAYIGGLQILILLFPQAFAGLFLKDAAVMAVCVGCIRRFCLGLVGIAVQYAYVDGLTAMGKVKYALPLSLFRKTLYIILLITMPMFLPVENIFYAGSISDIIGASFTLVMFFSVVRKKLHKEMQN
ncbi:MAG: MATE family efflux transporter [Anaerotignum sp.]|nr:MATE family efflux transporter [Anaerotignum sp.]